MTGSKESESVIEFRFGEAGALAFNGSELATFAGPIRANKDCIGSELDCPEPISDEEASLPEPLTSSRVEFESKRFTHSAGLTPEDVFAINDKRSEDDPVDDGESMERIESSPLLDVLAGSPRLEEPCVLVPIKEASNEENPLSLLEVKLFVEELSDPKF